jgi:hypothetical protein
MAPLPPSDFREEFVEEEKERELREAGEGFEPVGEVEQKPDELIDLQPKAEGFEPASLAGTVNAPVPAEPAGEVEQVAQK